MTHISERIAALLAADGWESLTDRDFNKLVDDFEAAGTVSNGRRLVHLHIDETGRWLERRDGWGKIQREVDLREYRDNPFGAIAAVLSPSEHF